jgi:putative nucleotidyltransferase with HDIG domain
MDTRAPAAGRDPSSVAALVTLVTSVASGCLALTVRSAWNGVAHRPGVFLAFFGLTICLQLITVEVYNRGTMSFAGCGLLAMGFTFGVGAAMATAVVMAATLVVRRRPKLHRGLFDAAQFSLAAGAGTAFFQAFGAQHWNAIARIGPALGACAVYMALNVGLLIAAMSLSDGTPAKALWQERFRWTTPYYLAAGPLAIALTVAYEKVGITGLLAFTLPPAMMMFSVRQYVNRTRQSVEEVRQANEELQAVNADLRDLFQFAGGLASRAHDRDMLAAYAQEAIARMAGARITFLEGDSAAGFALVAGDKRIGSLLLDASANFDADRWDRLQEAILPQLATAIESAELVAEVRRKHLATIAALSRSMEAKDDYTGGHTERVSDVAIALASRLGYTGADLDAIEVGALLHDIGKIGIPERILHKPGPLDEDEWKVMREHPIISEHILSGIDLSPLVLQVARSSHERIDGRGYPDGLAGEEIPLPARIVLVADAFDALTSDRPYRRGRAIRAAIDEIKEHSGTQFCPKVVAALERIWHEEPLVLGAGHLRAVEAGAA